MRMVTRFEVHETTGQARSSDVLSWGVPVPSGKAPAGASLRIAAPGGRLLPAQVDVQARWDDGSAKWVLVTVSRLTIAGGRVLRLSLVHAARRAIGAAAVVRVRRRAGGVSVATDRLRFDVRDSGPLVPSIEVRAGRVWRRLAGGMDLRAAIDHADGPRAYRASASPREVAVEVAGPRRAVIRIAGAHAAPDGRTFGPYVLRIEAMAGLAQLRLTHSVVYDGDPAKDFVRASEVELAADVGAGQSFAFGGDDGGEVRVPRQRIDWCPDFRHAELFQDSASHWRVTRWVDRARRGVFGGEGLRSDGWMELAGARGRVAAAVRDFWQNHPKSLSIDGAEGLLRIGLYPARAERLDLQRYSDLAYANTYEGPCTWKPETVPFDPRFGAHGIRKTHDFALFFDTPNASRAALFYARPLTARLAPADFARAAVTWPATARRSREWQERAERYLDFLGDAMVRDGGTGYVDYFDLPMGMELPSGRWHHDYGGLGYINSEALPGLGLWQAYFVTGREDALRMALAMVRHNADLDSYHAGPLAGYGSRHNVNHWGDMCKEPRISQPVDKRFAYYLAGDRSVLDLASVCRRMWDATLAKPRRLPLTAHVPALVSGLLFAEESGMSAERPWLLALADAIAASVSEHGQMLALLEVDAAQRTARPCPDSGVLSYMMFSCFGGPQTFAELAERYDHQPLRAALVRMARYLMRSRVERARMEGGPAISDALAAFRGLDLLGYAYARTGDEAIARHARRHLRAIAVEVGEVPQARYGVRGAGRRPALIGASLGGVTARERAAARRYYPFFRRQDTSQFFQVAVYLHKLQAILELVGR